MLGWAIFTPMNINGRTRLFHLRNIVHRLLEHMTVPCHSLVLLDYLLGNIQQSDIGFRVGLLSSGDNPQVTVKERLQVIGGQVLHIGIRQTRKN